MFLTGDWESELVRFYPMIERFKFTNDWTSISRLIKRVDLEDVDVPDKRLGGWSQ